MPLDAVIRAAVHEAARARRFPEHRDGLALLRQEIPKEEELRNGS